MVVVPNFSLTRRSSAEQSLCNTVMHHENEKSPSSVHREHAQSVQEQGIERVFDDVETSRVLRKIDWRLLPVLSFLYLLAFLDRSNLGNAKVAGLADDLSLTGEQYNLAATARSPGPRDEIDS